MNIVECIDSQHLIASGSQLPELVMEMFQEEEANTDKETLVLDVGAGNGRFLITAMKTFPTNFHVVSLERNPSLCDYLRKHYKDTGIVLADALHLPFEKSRFQQVVTINTAHEVCGGQSEEERSEKFRCLSGEISSVLKPNGRFLLWDGLLPENGEQETYITVRTNDAVNALNKFIKDYRGKKVIVEQTEEGKYKLSMTDLVTYLTKLPYLNSEYWETEREQLYPFLSLDQISSILNEVGLTVTKVRYPQSRNGLKNFLQSYDITGYDLTSLPPVQVMLEAIKH